MSWIDLVFGVILAFTTVNGLRRGLIRSVFDILALVVAVLIASRWYGALAPMISSFSKLPDAVGNIFSFFIVWLLAFVAISFAGGTFQKVVRKTFFASLDLLGGAFLGAMKGLIITALILQVIFVIPFPSSVTEGLQESIIVTMMRPVIGETYKTIFKMLPKEIPNVDKFFSSQDLPKLGK